MFYRRFLALVSVFIVTILASVAVAPASAQGGTVWKVTYYNNLFLALPVALDTTANEINFDWGTGSPAPGVNADNFSARFGTDVFFNQGTYRFTIRADDEFSLRVDDNIVLNTLDNAQPGQTLTVDVPLSGSHHLQIDYRERVGPAFLSLSWINVNAITSNVTPGSWTAEYYANTGLLLPASAVLTEASPSHDWGYGAPFAFMPVDYFSARWTTSQVLPAGTYRITVQSDDGVRVRVDGATVIDAFFAQSITTRTADVNLSAGTHTFVVEYVEFTELAVINFTMELLGGSQTVTPSVPSGATATVTAYVLNVRNAPSAINTLVLDKIEQNQVYSINGRSADGRWWRISVNGQDGWVSAAWVAAANAQYVPVVDSSPIGATQADVLVRNVTRLNLRSGPGTQFESLGVLATRSTLKVLGRNGDTSWLRVEYAGNTGWVALAYLQALEPTNFLSLPIVG